MYSWNLLYLAASLSVSAALPQVLDPSTSLATAATTTAILSSTTTSILSSATSDILSSTTTVILSSAPPVNTTAVLSSADTTATISSATLTLTIEPTISVPSSTTSAPTTTSTSAPSLQLHPNGNAAKCLDVRGDVRANGTPVRIFDCNGTPAQNWVISPGEGHVVLAGTNFCLDAGSAPANGVGMKIWECFNNLPAQDWFFTADQRIALTNKGFCLDLTDGNFSNTNKVQTWKCTDGDKNQVWSTSGTAITTTAGPTTTPGTALPPTTTAPTTIGTSSAPTTTSTSVSFFTLHPNGNAAKCLDVKGNVRANGTPVQIFDCNGSGAQRWVIHQGEGPVVLAGTNFCLDAGSAPANGVGLKIWQCFSNLPAQNWFHTADRRIALTNQGLCVDLTDGNLTNSNRVQTFKCTDADKNQAWSVGN